MIKLKMPSPEKAKKYFEAKLSFTLGPAELKHIMDEGGQPNIIDVRSAEDYAEGHIPGAIHLPEDQWRFNKGLTKKKTNVVYCYNIVCHLAARAAHSFASKGYPVMELEGGMEKWKDSGLPVEPSLLESEKKPDREMEDQAAA